MPGLQTYFEGYAGDIRTPVRKSIFPGVRQTTSRQTQRALRGRALYKGQWAHAYNHAEPHQPPVFDSRFSFAPLFSRQDHVLVDLFFPTAVPPDLALSCSALLCLALQVFALVSTVRRSGSARFLLRIALCTILILMLDPLCPKRMYAKFVSAPCKRATPATAQLGKRGTSPRTKACCR